MEEGLTRSDLSETLKWHVHESVTLLRCARLASTRANLSDCEVVMCPCYRSLTYTLFTAVRACAVEGLIRRRDCFGTVTIRMGKCLLRPRYRYIRNKSNDYRLRTRAAIVLLLTLRIHVVSHTCTYMAD